MHRFTAICRRLLALDPAQGPTAGPRQRVPAAQAAPPVLAEEPAAADAPALAERPEAAEPAPAARGRTPSDPAPADPAPARLPLQSAVGGIALLHIEHESRGRRVRSLARARVGVLGRPPIARAELDELLRPAGACVAGDGRKVTLWLVGPGASEKRLEELRRLGRPVVDVDGLRALAAEYERTVGGSWFDEAVRAAIMRLRHWQRALFVRGRRPAPHVVAEPDPSPRMRSAHRPTGKGGALRPLPARTDRPSADQELAAAIEAATRAKRSADPRCRLYDPSSRP